MLNPELKILAEIKAPERTFLSIYISGPDSISAVEKKLIKIRALMKNSNEKSEHENFEENVADVEKYLKKNPLKTGSLGIFACKQLDFFQTVTLESEVDGIVWIDSSPYIRPLAEFFDDYEHVAVVVADNEKVKIFLVTASVFGPIEEIKGNIKNHVKVGGWSQQRYERRRDNQLTEFAHEIRDSLLRLDREEKYGHILLVGGKEILNIVYESMPKEYQNKIIEKNLDLSKGEDSIHNDIVDLLFIEEHRTEQEYWEQIREEYLRGGLAAVGIDDVLQVAKEGRVDKVIIDHAFQPLIERFQKSSGLDPAEAENCTVSDSSLLFNVSQVNELIGLLIQSGSEFHFTDSIPKLGEVGGIAAFLRY